MTKADFILKVPGTINHNTRGYGVLEIIVDNIAVKGVCYRHPDNSASCGQYGATWREVYNKFCEHLKSEGYMPLTKTE